MAQARKDPRTGQVVLYDDNGRPLGGSTGEVPFSDRSISDISLEEAMQQNVPQPKQPSQAATLKGLAKDYALNKAKSYALDKGASLFASEATPAALSSLGPTVGAASGAGVGSGITGVAGLDTIVPAATTTTGAAGAGAGLTGGVGMGGITAGAYTGYQQLKGAQNIGKGEDLDWQQQAALALPTFGLSLLYNPAKKFFGFGGQSTHQEEKLRNDLAKRGINVANAGVKEWELNDKFKQTRNEADLTAKDIINSAQLYDKIPNYAALSTAQKEAIANEALKNKLVREHHGTIQINPNDAFNKFAASQVAAPVAAPTTGGGGQRRAQKKAPEKKEKQVPLLKSLIPEGMVAPNYEKNPTQLFSNPYLK